MNGVRLQTSAITTENSAPTGSASRLRVKPDRGEKERTDEAHLGVEEEAPGERRRPPAG